MQARFMTRTNIVWIISICLKNDVKILKVSPVLPQFTVESRIMFLRWTDALVPPLHGIKLAHSSSLQEYEFNTFHMLPI